MDCFIHFLCNFINLWIIFSLDLSYPQVMLKHFLKNGETLINLSIDIYELKLYNVLEDDNSKYKIKFQNMKPNGE